MGKTPDVIIVARHGARLDAESRDWHLTAAAPYDTPISYGGWQQTRALGARIASLLHARHTSTDDDDRHSSHSSSPTTNTPLGPLDRPESLRPAKRKKHKIVVHTSPYLRCVQSAIGICAGISQYEGNLVRFESHEIKRPTTPRPLYTPARSKTLDTAAMEIKYGNGYRSRSPALAAADLLGSSSKPTLRVDSYLGEWQNPEYYAQMESPPEAEMMVANAKLELQKTADPIQGSNIHEHIPHRRSVHFEGGLQGGQDHKSSPLSMDTLAATLPAEDAIAESTIDSSEHTSNSLSTPAAASSNTPRSIGYFPPTPNYAISTSEPIPGGYVAHARDACVDLDLQWDSIREPQDWPDGLPSGEEWSAMHNRFRMGLMNMLRWYKLHDATSTSNSDKDASSEEEYDELVLVIVTHSAGCNAIMGAITDQPCLIDFGMASLTFATLKDPSLRPRAGSSSERRHSVVDVSQGDDYKITITASLDHLRAGSSDLLIPQLQNPAYSSNRPDSKRHRGISLSAATSPLQSSFEPERPTMRSKNSSLGSIRRVRPTPSGSGSNFPGLQDLTSPLESPGSSGHLWDPRRASTQSANSIQEEDAIEIDPFSSYKAHTESGHRHYSSSSASASASASQQEREKQQKVYARRRSSSKKDCVLEERRDEDAERTGEGEGEKDGRRPSQKGLWGPAKVENRRRWTVTDR